MKARLPVGGGPAPVANRALLPDGDVYKRQTPIRRMIIYKYNFIRKTMRVFNYTIDTTLSYLFCIIIYYNNVFEVKATNGNNHLGGDDFDEAIMDYLVSEPTCRYCQFCYTG